MQKDRSSEPIRNKKWEFNYLAIDELTKQDENTFDYLMTIVRSAKMWNPYKGTSYTIPTKVVCGCNPGGRGHRWVKKRFIDTTVVEYHPETNTPLRTRDHIEIMEVPSKEDVNKTEEIKINVRFIPSSWRDNPYLNKAYVAMLAKQPEHRRKMDMEGNWDVIAGRMFDFEEDNFIDDYHAMKLIKDYRPDIYISVDWGWHPAKFSAHWYAVFFDHTVIVFDEYYGSRVVFEDWVDNIRKKSLEMFITGTCLPHDMFVHGDRYRDKQGRIIGETKAEVFEDAGLNPMGIESGKGTVMARFDKIHSAARLKNKDGSRKRVIISRKCPELIRELEDAVTKDDGTGMIDPGVDDHAIDDLGLFLTFYSQDISPIGLEEFKPIDKRNKWIKRMDHEERLLRGHKGLDLEEDKDFFGVDKGKDLV